MGLPNGDRRQAGHPTQHHLRLVVSLGSKGFVSWHIEVVGHCRGAYITHNGNCLRIEYWKNTHGKYCIRILCVYINIYIYMFYFYYHVAHRFVIFFHSNPSNKSRGTPWQRPEPGFNLEWWKNSQGIFNVPPTSQLNFSLRETVPWCFWLGKRWCLENEQNLTAAAVLVRVVETIFEILIRRYSPY